MLFKTAEYFLYPISYHIDKRQTQIRICGTVLTVTHLHIYIAAVFEEDANAFTKPPSDGLVERRPVFFVYEVDVGPSHIQVVDDHWVVAKQQES